MAPRPIATGNISFGLVSIPVKLYPSSDHSADIRFNMLRAKDATRVKQQYISAADGEVVPRDQMIKGYEFAKGQYVTFSDEEAKSLMEKASPAIEITEFVPLSQVDPIYYDKAYYLGPEEGGERAYRLLAKAMRDTGRSAVAKYAARGKQYLVLLRPFDKGVVMQQLHYPDEIRAFSEVPLDEGSELKEGELELAKQLIEQIAADAFEPEQYKDDVRTRIRAAIQQKIDGHEVMAAEEEAPKAKILDLMQALKASLGDQSDDASGEQAAADGKSAHRSPRTKASRKPSTKRSASG